MSWVYFQEDWSLLHKVTFDGINRIITVAPNVSSIKVKEDIYSDFKEWLQIRDNAKFLPAIRTTGGDPIGGGAYTGDVYFLINNWRILIDHSCNIDGVIYSDNYPSPFIQVTGTQIVTNKVSSLVSVIAPIVSVEGLTVPTPAEIWSHSSRTLSVGQIPSVQEIRVELDTNSSKLETILSTEWTDTEKSQIRNRLGIDGTNATSIVIPTLATKVDATAILSAISDISIATSSINTPVVGFTLNSGIVTTGSYTDTRTLDGTSHVIRDNLTAFNIEYLFDVGLNATPSQLTFIGKVTDNHETAVVSAWDYISNHWDVIGTIAGTKALGVSTFTLYNAHVGKDAGQIGDVKIRFTCATISDITVTIDQLYISYAVTPKETGYSGHAVSADSTHITLNADASSIDNYYVPALLTVNHGTGAQQYAKVIAYNGTTRTLTLELPMAQVVNTTSHITLGPWADVNNAAIAEAVRTELSPELTHLLQVPTTGTGLTTTQSTMLLEMYNLLGLDPSIPLVVTQSSRQAGSVLQSISTDSAHTVVTRV